MIERKCRIRYHSVNDATGHMDMGVALLRTAGIALRNTEEMDDEALAAVAEILSLALTHLEPVAAWVLEVHNASVEESNQRYLERMQQGAGHE